MRLKYCFLWKISLVLVIFGISCLQGFYCFATSEEELNRKADELFASGIRMERQEKNIDAEKIYEQCLRFAKENNVSHLESPTLHRLAIIKAKEQKIAESEQYFREALKLDGENTALLCDFAKLYSDQKNYTDAETILKNTLLIAPDHRRTLFNLGLTIVLQKDRQTEGLRYLKLAIGEAAAYRELAKIYRQQGNNAQAEFAEQRATLIEKQTPPPTNTITSPTVSMDAQTKQELIQHVKEELLRLETSEIADAVRTAPVKTITPQGTPQPEPLPTEPPTTEPLAANSSLPEPLLIKPMPPESLLARETSSAKPIHDPFPVVEPQKIGDLKGDLKKDQPVSEHVSTFREPFATPAVDKTESLPAETNRNIDKELPETVKPLQALPEPPKQQAIKILKPEPLTNEPVKTFPQDQDVRSNRKTNDIRTLPATDFRISNSTEGDTEIPRQPEVHALTIVPLEDEAANKSIPEYTAINVRKIPLTEKTSAYSRTEEKKIPASAKAEKKDEKHSVSRFQNPVSPDSAATISLSLNKTKTPQNISSDKTNSDFSARLYLEQPINLITFGSQHSQAQHPQAPIPTFDSSEKPLQENRENQHLRVSPNEFTEHQQSNLENRITQNDQNDHATDSQRPSKSILRPGAGKIKLQENPDSYVYVDTDTLKNKESSGSPKPAEKETVPKSVAETNSITKSVAESFSLMKPIPDKFGNRLTHPLRSSQITSVPSLKAEIETETTAEISETHQTPSVTTITETVRQPVEKTPQPEIPLRENSNVRDSVGKNSVDNPPVDKNPIVQNNPNIDNPNINNTNIDNTVSTKPEINKKSDLQFSSLQTPTVLRFEIASATKPESSDKPETLNEPDKPNKTVTQKQISIPAEPVQPEQDLLQQTIDNTFQPPTVLKFEPAQSEIASKPTPAQTISVPTVPLQTVPAQTISVPTAIQTEPVQTAQTQTAQTQTVPIRETEPLLTANPKPVIKTEIAASPNPAVTETTIPAVPKVPIVSAIPVIPTVQEVQPVPTVSEIAQPQLPPTPPNSAESIPHADSVAVLNSISVPAIPVPVREQNPIQELPFSKQPTEPKTETAVNTSPPITPDHVEAFLPILTVRQPEEITVQQPPSVPMPEVLRSNPNLKFKAANETATILPAEPITEQTTNQQPKIATHSETLKFIVPAHPQPKLLQNQENIIPKPPEEIVSKPVEIPQKPAEEVVPKPVEIPQKPAEEVVSKPVEIPQKPAEEVVTKPVEIPQKSTEEEVVAKSVEIPPKPPKAIVFKPVEVPQKPAEEIVSKPIDVLPRPVNEPANEIISKSEPVKSEPLQPEPLKPEPLQPEPLKPEPVLTLIPLNIDLARKTETERKPLRNQTLESKPAEQSDTEEVFTLKRIQKTQPKLKTEMEIAERLALNSISRRANSGKSEELELAEKTDENEPIGFATTRKVPSAVVLREVNDTVDEFLKPKENFGKHPIFSLDASSKNNFQEENTLQDQEEETGFARSGKYSKKTQQDTQQDSFQNTAK
ncbi:MAG: hypothetical protein LBU34_08540 [Planctomycetaceae bacterium]|jgi:Tfp pilus assembly protein PilF|nr:hypothetical protein [Planctomycetaceae bacterium]